jgi:aminoglycoside 2'-N-acetyltransferase I
VSPNITRYSALILEAYEAEVAGAAYFDRLVSAYPSRASFLRKCAELERTTAERLSELLRKYQLTPAAQTVLDERGATDAGMDAACGWMTLMERSVASYACYVANFKALEGMGHAEDQPILAALTAHEIQLIEWMHAEVLELNRAGAGAAASVSAVAIFSADSLGAAGERELHEWLNAAYGGDFSAQDWLHARGGQRMLVRDSLGIVSHAALVPRSMVLDGRALRAGYVEAVATRADQRRRGHVSRLLGKLGEIIARDYDIGVLSTGLPDVYAALGWERWCGASYVQTPGGRVRTAADDDGLMVLRTSRTRLLDVSGDIVADWREGDVW